MKKLCNDETCPILSRCGRYTEEPVAEPFEWEVNDRGYPYCDHFEENDPDHPVKRSRKGLRLEVDGWRI